MLNLSKCLVAAFDFFWHCWIGIRTSFDYAATHINIWNTTNKKGCFMEIINHNKDLLESLTYLIPIIVALYELISLLFKNKQRLKNICKYELISLLFKNKQRLKNICKEAFDFIKKISCIPIGFFNYLKFKINQLHQDRQYIKQLRKGDELVEKFKKGELTKKEFFENNPPFLTIKNMLDFEYITEDDVRKHNHLIKAISDNTEKIKEINKRISK
jgi:hypothetical protein